jgi:hypothetical protein
MNSRQLKFFTGFLGLSLMVPIARAAIIYVPVSPSAALPSIDFDGNGTPDVTFTASSVFQTNPAFFTKTVTLGFAPGDSFDVNPYFQAGQDTAAPTVLEPSHLIGPADSFGTGTSNAALLGSYNSTPGGTFFGGGNFQYPVTNGYIGLDLLLSDNQNHYAWVQYQTVQPTGPGEQPVTYAITGYAYETTPNAPIGVGAVPEPASLGLLAFSPLLLRRRR